MEEKINNKRKLHGKGIFVFISIMVLITIVFFTFGGYEIGVDKGYQKCLDEHSGTYDIAFAGVETKSGSLYASFSLYKNNDHDSVTFYAKDFSIMVANLPKIAYKLTLSDSSYYYDSDSWSNGYYENLTVVFDCTELTVDKPIEIYYKGKLLKLTETQTFKMEDNINN